MGKKRKYSDIVTELKGTKEQVQIKVPIQINAQPKVDKPIINNFLIKSKSHEDLMNLDAYEEDMETNQ